MFAVLLFAGMVRLPFLGAIQQVVFDEVHFGKFISSYCCTGERFFDIHPPVGKLIIAGGAYVAGYRGGVSFESIGQQYGEISITDVRIAPAMAGVLLSCIIFVLLRQTGVSLSFSFLGAVAVALDNALIVESRLIVTDSILLAATFGALACAWASVRSSYNWQHAFWAVGAGICSGVAVGTKFTGLIGIMLVGIIFLHEAYVGRSGVVRSLVIRSLLAGVAVIFVYTLGWVFHFSLLTMPGSGDAWGVPTGVFWADVVNMHKQMVSANYNLVADHPYGSKWYTWPFMMRPVFYWQGGGSNQFIYLLGNPVVWWGSFLGLCVGIFSLLVYSSAQAKSRITQFISSGAWIFILGYAASFIPLMRVPRVLFLYHYLTPLLFSLLFGIWWIDGAFVKYKNISLICGGILILFGFVFISPLTYGFPFSDMWYRMLFTISSWR